MIENLKLLAIGHSHMGAIQRAYKLREKENAKLFKASRFIRLNFEAFMPNFVQEDSQRKVSPDLKNRLKHIVRTEKPDTILLSLMGNEYNAFGMLKHPKQFDCNWPSHDLPAEEAATVLTFDIFRAEIAETARKNVFLLTDEFKNLDAIDVFVLCPPPPINDEEHINKYPGAFSGRIKKFGLSSAEFRMKIWLMYADILEIECKRSGFNFLESPFAARAEGYLAEQYRNDDPTHGNPSYGELVLKDLEKKLAKKGGK